MNVRRWFRFSLATLLFSTSCLAGFLAGFRYGDRTGQTRWQEQSLEVHTYNIGDLLPISGTPEYAEDLAFLCDVLEVSLVQSGEMRTVGQGHFFFLGRKDDSIIVLHTINRHKEIEGLLDMIRQKKKAAEARGLVFCIREDL